MSKTSTEYLASEPTSNQEAFLAWVLAETDVSATLKTAAAREAFALGVRCAGLYSRYQASKRAPVRKASTKKSAAA